MGIVRARRFVIASVLILTTSAPVRLLADSVARATVSRTAQPPVSDGGLVGLLTRLKAAVAAERAAVETLLADPAKAPQTAWSIVFERREETDRLSNELYAGLERTSNANPAVAEAADTTMKNLKMSRRDVDAVRAGIHGDPAAPAEQTHGTDELDSPQDHRVDPLLSRPETTASFARPPLARERIAADGGRATGATMDFRPAILGIFGVAVASAAWWLVGLRNKSRRFSNRKPCAVAVTITLGAGTQLRGQTRDISWGGASVLLDDPQLTIRADQRVVLNFSTKSSFNCSVIRARQGVVSLRWDILTEASLAELDKMMMTPAEELPALARETAPTLG